MDTTYRKIEKPVYPRSQATTTPEARYWAAPRSASLLEQLGPVTSVAYAPIAPSSTSSTSSVLPKLLAITSAFQVMLFDPSSRSLKRGIARFKSVAHCVSFRGDGKLLVAGDEGGAVHVIESSGKTQLRLLRGHQAAVRASVFGLNPSTVFSSSDDYSVRSWDLASGKEEAEFSGHGDYVRCIATTPAGKDLLWSGSYDHTIKLWDTRAPASSSAAASASISLNQGAPVESIAVLPGGNLVAAAGGNEVRIWDVLSGGKLVHRMSHHQKTITSLTVDGTKTRLLTGSLDGHVKIHDLSDYKVVHAIKYPGPVFSVATSVNNGSLAVGMQNNLVSIRTRRHVAKKMSTALSSILAMTSGGIGSSSGSNSNLNSRASTGRVGSYRYLMRGMNANPKGDELVVSVSKKPKLAEYDKLMQKFRYREALDAAVRTNEPGTFVAVITELSRRGGIISALSGRDAATLAPVLAMIMKWITTTRFSAALIPVVEHICGIYGPVLGESAQVDLLLTKIRNKVRTELAICRDLHAIQGQLDTILACSSAVVAEGEAGEGELNDELESLEGEDEGDDVDMIDE